MRFSELSFQRLSVIISLLVMICFACSYLVIKYFGPYSEAKKQVETIHFHDLERVAVALDISKQEVESALLDYAAWDKTAEFIALPNQEFLNEDLNEHTFKSLKINGIFLFNPDKELVWGDRYDLEALRSVSSDSYQKVLPDLLTNVSSLSTDSINAISRFVVIDGSPHLVYLSRVCNSFGADCTKGYILIFKELVSDYFKKVELITGLSLNYEISNKDAFFPENRNISTIEHFDKTSDQRFVIAIKHSVEFPRFISEIELYALLFFSFFMFCFNYIVAKIFITPINKANKRLNQFEKREHIPDASMFSSREMKDFAQSINRVIVELEQKREILQQESYQDPLTELANRRRLENFLLDSLNEQGEKYISLFLIDIDHFKLLNDNYGHVWGDKVLTQVASALKQVQLKGESLVARYGGEEFCIVSVTQEKADLPAEAEKLVACIRSLDIKHEYSPTEAFLTISVGGVDMLNPSESDYRRLVNYADKSLYLAKRAGRNRYKVESIRSVNKSAGFYD